MANAGEEERANARASIEDSSIEYLCHHLGPTARTWRRISNCVAISFRIALAVHCCICISVAVSCRHISSEASSQAGKQPGQLGRQAARSRKHLKYLRTHDWWWRRPCPHNHVSTLKHQWTSTAPVSRVSINSNISCTCLLEPYAP